MKKDILAKLISFGFGNLSVIPVFLLSSTNQDGNEVYKKYQTQIDQFLKLIKPEPYKHFDNTAIKNGHTKIISDKYEINKYQIKESDENGKVVIDLGVFEFDNPIDILIHQPQSGNNIVQTPQIQLLEKIEGNNIPTIDKNNSEQQKSIQITDLPTIYNPTTKQHIHTLKLNSDIPDAFNQQVKEKLSELNKQLKLLEQTLYQKLPNSQYSDELNQLQEKIWQTKQEILKFQETSYLVKSKIYVLKTILPSISTLSHNKQIIFNQTFKIHNNSFNLNSSPSQTYGQLGSYFDKETFWFDTSKFESPFPDNIQFLLEPKSDNSNNNLGFFVESIITDKFYKPIFDFEKVDLYIYDLTKLKINSKGQFIWPDKEYFSQNELQDLSKDPSKYYSSLSSLPLVVAKNKKTNFAQFHLVLNIPSLNPKNDLKKIDDFYGFFQDLISSKKILEEKISQAKVLLEKSTNFDLKRKLEYQINQYNQEIEKIESNSSKLNFKFLLPYYFKKLSKTPSNNVLISQNTYDKLSDSINSFLIPLINPTNPSINNFQSHPKSAFFNFLIKHKNISQTQIKDLKYFTIYSHFQEYLTHLANNWTTQQVTIPIKLQFNAESTNGNSFTSIKEKLNQYKKSPNLLFQDLSISLVSNPKRTTQPLSEKILSNIKIEEIKLQNNDKELFLKFKYDSTIKNSSGDDLFFFHLYQTEYVIDLENKKEITYDFLKSKLFFDEQKIRNFIKQFSRSQLFNFLKNNPKFILNFIHQSSNTLPPLDLPKLANLQVIYDWNYYSQTDGKSLKFKIQSPESSLDNFEVDNLNYLGELFENTPPNYFDKEKKIIEINLYPSNPSLKTLDELKQIIEKTFESWLENHQSKLENYPKTQTLIKKLTEKHFQKLLSPQKSIESKRKSFIDIELKSNLDNEPSDLREIQTLLSKNSLTFRFTNIKPFDFNQIKFKEIKTEINTIFSPNSSTFETENRYKTLMQEFKNAIFSNLSSQILLNSNKLNNGFDLNDFVTPTNNSSLFKFKIIPSNTEFNWNTDDYEYDEEESKLFHKELENLFYGRKKANLEVLLPKYLKQYYLNSDKLSFSVENTSTSSKLVDFSKLGSELDQVLELKHPKWKELLNSAYKHIFDSYANLLNIPIKKTFSPSDFLKIPSINLKNIVFNNSTTIDQKIQSKIIELKGQLQSKEINNNIFLVAIAQTYLDFFGELINNSIKTQISKFTQLINESYDENWFNISEFISKEKEYKFDVLKIFSFILPHINFKELKSFDELEIKVAPEYSKEISVIPYQLKSGHFPWGFGKTQTSLNFLFDKQEIFDLSWMKLILDLNKKLNDNFTIPKNLKDFLYKKYSLSEEDNPKNVIDPDNPNNNSSDKDNSSKDNNPNDESNKIIEFNIKSHLSWIVPLSIISVIGIVLLIFYLWKIKRKTKQNKLNNDDYIDEIDPKKLNIIDLLDKNKSSNKKQEIVTSPIKKDNNSDGNDDEINEAYDDIELSYSNSSENENKEV
ncbi:hypothetical protein [Metamycoplasma alkalescens]|nr:hypothetical protein [Metamycoplasma alkalescens]